MDNFPGVNSAFTTLRTLIPTEPVDRKLSKIETLRLASSYISHLQAQLLAEWNQIIAACSSNENDQQPTFEDFVRMDDDVLVSEELTDDDIISEFLEIEQEEEEEGCETCEEPLERVSKHCPRPFVCVFFIVLGVISTHPVIANLNVALVSRAVARGIGARGKQSCVSTVFTDIQSTRGFKKTAQRMHILHCKPEKI
uniref:BHLH domain-containing protein n=1 Tax=Timema poppense TaxID=170557 RepID=A0A7R9DAS3_TIMPO|nr:unnamed protein product [Timema poppensis]